MKRDDSSRTPHFTVDGICIVYAGDQTFIWRSFVLDYIRHIECYNTNVMILIFFFNFHWGCRL